MLCSAIVTVSEMISLITRQRKKCGRVKSGDLAGLFIGSLHPLDLPGKCFLMSTKK